MRISLLSLTAILALVIVTACNSRQAQLTQLPAAPNQTPQPSVAQNPAEKARRIKAEDLHELWEKGNVLIVDTRSEPAFKQDHIKGAILIPAGEVGNHIDELPRDKMIVTYCT